MNNKIDYDKIKNDINNYINEIRLKTFKDYDNSINKLIKGLQEIDIPYTKSNNDIVFMFDKSSVKKWFYSKIKDEGFSLKDLVVQSNDMSKPFLEGEELRIYEMLKDIFNSSLEGKLPIIQNNTEESVELEDEEDYIGRSLNKSKKYTRTNKQSFSFDKIYYCLSLSLSSNFFGSWKT